MKPRHIIYAVLATVIIFAAGVVTGGLLVNVVRPPPVAQPQPGFQMARMDQFQRAVHQLDLTPDQRQRINRIVRERQEYIADIMRLVEPDLPGQFFKLRRDINQELRPDQLQRLDEMWVRVEQQRKFPNRNNEMMGKPADGPMNRPDGQSPPPRMNGQRPGRPPLGERQGSPNPPPEPPQ